MNSITRPSTRLGGAQLPRSALEQLVRTNDAIKARPRRRPSGSASTILDPGRWQTFATVEKSAAPSAVAMAEQPEEYFEGVVIAVGSDALELRTVSSQGEEGVATLPLDQVPDSEKKYAVLGAPVRVSIFSKGPHGRREWISRIRFLRPNQWRLSISTDPAVDLLVGRIEALLSRG